MVKRSAFCRRAALLGLSTLLVLPSPFVIWAAATSITAAVDSGRAWVDGTRSTSSDRLIRAMLWVDVGVVRVRGVASGGRKGVRFRSFNLPAGGVVPTGRRRSDNCWRGLDGVDC